MGPHHLPARLVSGCTWALPAHLSCFRCPVFTMAGSYCALLPAALLLLLASPLYGNYILTTPRQTISEHEQQLCVFVTDPAAPVGVLNVSLSIWDSSKLPENRNQTIFQEIIDIPSGKYEKCHNLKIPASEGYSGNLHIKGNLSGLKLNDTLSLSIRRSSEKTFIQTDRYKYRPGEKVQFRILTITGNKMEVSTRDYPEIWVTTPSRNRIAQWKNVSNSEGLVHLDFQLADEPEEGSYIIHLKRPQGEASQSFRVEEFVLPRYEVTIKPPAYILGTAENFTFTVCANYTFGQPLKGNLSFNIHNNQDRKCRVSQTTNTTIHGCSDIVVSADEMRIMDCNVYSVRASALIEEEGTGVQMTASHSTSITRSAVTFKSLYKDEFMKPNLPYSVKLRAELPDGTPAADVPVEVCAAGCCTNDTTAPNGILNIVLPNFNSYSVLVKALNCRAGMRSSEYTDRIQHYFSPSNSSLLIIAPEDKLECSPKAPSKHVLPVLFSARDQPTAAITVQIVSRGQIQHSATQEVTLTTGDLPFEVTHMVEPLPDPIEGTVRGLVNLEITLPPTASPRAKVLVWYTRADGEVVSDMRELEVDRCLANNVSMSWSTKKAQPGETASFTLNGEPNSVCSVGVVDKSTELLARDPDPITLQRLFNFVDGFTIYKWSRSQINDREYCNRRKRQEEQAKGGSSPRDIIPYFYGYYTSYVDAIRMFSDAGLYVLTDLTVETRPCEKEDYQVHYGFGGVPGGGAVAFDRPIPAAAPPQALGGAAFAEGALDDNMEDIEHKTTSETTEEEAPRTNFPETWLWDIMVVPENGTRKVDQTLPDTITQWVGKAVCVHPQAGVGLSQRESITTFTPFFVDLTLPPTVKRGETLPVKMSVFNYHGKDLPISITLEDSVEYDILEEPESPGVRGKRSACIPANDKAVLTVRVTPKVIADVNLTVSAAVDATDFPACGEAANSPQRRDALVRPIKVEPDGFPREKTFTKYICSEDFKSGTDSLESWNLALPPEFIEGTTERGFVEGSERGWVTAVGDLLALSLENLGHLIRMPYGCGEQNMLNFAPNIFLLDYLETTRQATPEATAKLMRYMNTGYQRQLLYRRNNGSYSAFGNADESGSTWLTAFVLKSFTQAKKYIQVDEEKLNQTRQWLLSQQGKDGCFTAVGKVLHKSMQGGVSNSKTPAPLTAYVLVSLLEGGEQPTAPPLDMAAQCLNGVSSRHPYTLALKAYAMALAGRPEAADVLTELESIANVTSNSMYWKLPESRTRAAAVEVAGYAILAMMTLNPETYEPKARKVVKWITTQRNGQGGFYSTQDTVVAMQALTLFESHRYQGPLNVVASVSAEGLEHSFTVNDDNKLLQQLKTLPTLPTQVNLTMTGEGCAVLQGVLRYNIPNPEPSDAFDLTVNTNTVPDRLCVTKRITACASYRLPDGASNMVVIEVDLISGYIPDKIDLKELIKQDKNIKRYEVDGSKINFYINELRERDTCVNFKVTRTVDVEDVKPGTVVVYDYYQEEFSISMRYTLPPNDECR
uniref:Alpha-2 macroglobulin n=1 Tax=Portunus trituberculatus TaxID=210409 RepID=A0A5S9BF63_PORTR|nr:alpha-2 macroglobulin [Portunus trituberculatus]